MAVASPRIGPFRGGIGVAPLGLPDVPGAARVAVRTLPASRLAQLGEPFMRAFFAVALQHIDTLAAMAVASDGRRLGYALATADVRAFSRYVQPRIALDVGRALLDRRRVHLLPRFIAGLFESGAEPRIPAELLLLYVDQDSQRHGAGRELLRWLEAAFTTRHVSRYRVEVRSPLGDAKAFYRAVGFAFEQERHVLGEPMTYLVRSLQ